MREFLSACTSLVLLLGLGAGSFAHDVERMVLPAGELQSREVSPPELHPKDACWIWMDQLGEYAWANTANWFDSCCAFKKYVDPDSALTDCQPPYFPFRIESMKIGLHSATALDSVKLIFDWDIEELGVWDESMGCYRPGDEIWRSEPMAISLLPGWYGWVDVSLPSVWVWGPFFISWHLRNNPPPGQWGWLTDQAASTVCWNWINYACAGDPNWYEWVYDLGYPWNDGNLLFRVSGRPEWDVAVDMIGVEDALPATFSLTQNYPNPFNANTEIRYQVPIDSHVTVRIFNVRGQEVITLVNDDQKAGAYGVIWKGMDSRGREVASGLYFCQLKARDDNKTIKMLLLR